MAFALKEYPYKIVWLRLLSKTISKTTENFISHVKKTDCQNQNNIATKYKSGKKI